MPEMTFTVQWPDGAVQDCYSPSLVMHDHLRAGATYTVADFLERSGAALDTASERVRARYGFACSSAAATGAHLRAAASRYAPHQQVQVLQMEPQLPTSAGTTGTQESR